VSASGLVTLTSGAAGSQQTGDIQRQQPVFSISKIFLAVAALRMAGSGAVDLDEEAARWLAEIPAGITLRELLSHTSGLGDYATTSRYQLAVDSSPGQPWELAEILAVGLAAERTPTGQFRYSNAGYWIAGAILEQIAGMALGALLRREVFDPAGLTDTCYPDLGDRLTPAGYDTRWAGPAGAAWSTAADLGRFLAALFGGTLLAASSLAELMAVTPVPPQSAWRRPGYGLGLMIDTELGIAGHGGGGPGYRSAAFARLGDGSGAVSSAVVLTRAPDSTDPVDTALKLLAPVAGPPPTTSSSR
jgi:CubicO group peptidase (beta-lactamase class C family)